MDELQVSTVLIKDEDREVVRVMALERIRIAGQEIAKHAQIAAWKASTGKGQVRKMDEHGIIGWLEEAQVCRDLLGQVGWRPN